MKKQRSYIIPVLLIPFLIAIAFEFGCANIGNNDKPKAIPLDSTLVIYLNDTSRYSGSNVGLWDTCIMRKAINMRDYQLEVFQDSTVIYDGNRKVGVIPYNKHCSMDSLISLDNL